MSIRLLVLSTFLLGTSQAFCQGADAELDEPADSQPAISIGAYLDIFYGYDFNKPATEQRLPYLFQHNRHNEFNLNHGILSLNVDQDKYRVNLAFQGGTYVNDNYAAEPEVFRNIDDANIGLALNAANSLWLDVGIFGGSWIGFQDTRIIHNDVLGHNLVSENTPYYMAGARASYAPDERWSLALLVVNGWQRIRRVSGNSLPGFGTQVTYSSSERLQVNWSTYIGTDDPDATRRMRYFNNLYAILQFNDRWSAKLGFDFGFQQDSKGSSNYQSWMGLVAMGRYKISDAWAVAARYEYFSDPNEVITPSLSPSAGYETGGFSGNVDYRMWEKILARLEVRHFSSNDAIYPKGMNLTSGNLFVVAAIVFELEKEL